MSIQLKVKKEKKGIFIALLKLIKKSKGRRGEIKEVVK